MTLQNTMYTWPYKIQCTHDPTKYNVHMTLTKYNVHMTLQNTKYSKTCLKWPLKKNTKIGFQYRLSL